MVRHPFQAVSAIARPITVRALLCCLALLAGCGGKPAADRQPAHNPGRGVSSSVRTATCLDWRRGSVAQRRWTVEQLREFAGGPVGSSSARRYGPVLDNERAYRLLTRYCAPRFARGFKLYKLYVRAAGFIGH